MALYQPLDSAGGAVEAFASRATSSRPSTATGRQVAGAQQFNPVL
jgi:hypothetical protein